MSLPNGTRVGAYEVIAPLGQGGMGEVYRARDHKLQRDVAIKILRGAVAIDADQLVRFEREAHTLAALNHANIAQIFGVEDGAGAEIERAIVMEFVDGPTLADRIAAGPVPFEDALPIARQIVEALEAAHEVGIVHRDLKPANIKIRPDGTVKVLDFGLAKATDAAAGHRAAATAALAANSPTLTSPALTRAGVILGTAAYMSPEQAKAKPVDKRSDIWSFGCTFYEMLTGRQPFAGEDITDTLTSVMRDTPDWNALPAEVPPRVHTLLARCLEKQATLRLRDIGEARIALQHDDRNDASHATSRPPSRPVWPRMTALAVAAAAGAAAVGTASWLARSTEPVLEASRLTIVLPSGMNTSGQSPIAMTPDGRTIVVQARGRLYRRSLAQFEFDPIAGSERAEMPVISPDGHWVLFHSDGYYSRVRLSGGPPERLVVSAESYPPSWSSDGTVVFSSIGGFFSAPATGGTARSIASPDKSRGEVRLLRPQVSTDARLVVSEVQNQDGVQIGVTVLATGERRLLGLGRYPRWGPHGHVLYQHENTWWAAPFDNRGLTFTGPAFPVLHASDGGTATDIAYTDSTLAYGSRRGAHAAHVLWVDRTGRRTPAVEAPADYETPRLSPDGTRLAITIVSMNRNDLWIYELARGARVRLTTSGPGRRPTWNPAGDTLTYQSAESGNEDIFVMAADGSAVSKSILDLPGAQFPDSWSPDGKHIAYSEGTPSPATRDIFVLPVDGGKPMAFINGPANQRSAQFSRDGKWMAYVSDESGRDEVYVTSFPGRGGKIVVSTDGGVEPVWSRDGKELFYKRPGARTGETPQATDALMAVPIQLQPFRAGRPVRLFDLPLGIVSDSNLPNYDVAPDGRFLMIEESGLVTDEIRVVFNWFTEALRKAGPERAAR